MSEWREVELKNLGAFSRGQGGPRSDETSDGIPCVRYGDLYTFHGEVIRGFCSFVAPDRSHAYTQLRNGDIVFAASGETFEEIGKATAFVGSQTVLAGGDTIIFRPDQSLLNPIYGGYALNSDRAIRHRSKMGQGSSVIHISGDNLSIQCLPLPPLPQQRRIAEILSTVDDAIEQTERLIAKQQQIKAGLMQDLFTRGVWTEASIQRARQSGLSGAASAKVGQLRPPREDAPELYKESHLGWIPVDWEVRTLGAIMQSLIDGPFGSNLKSEHYVVEAGVRVVRLQNIKEGEYNDSVRAFISESHAAFLSRHTVVGGDILIAALGEDNYPVGRACCYPHSLASAINKADCLRLRCLPECALNAFMMNFLNTELARKQIRRYEQGVTRKRINGGNMKKVCTVLPDLSEQEIIVLMIESESGLIDSLISQLDKLKKQKQGLMQDLLSGKVEVN